MIKSDTIIEYDDCIVKYIDHGNVGEITGDWFHVKTVDPHTTHISVDENKENTPRSITIGLGGDLTFVNYINIKQN